MNLRNRVKQLLRMCGHAFVGTVHDHLNDVDRQLSQIASQISDLRAVTDNLAKADGALLQGGIRTINLIETLTWMLDNEVPRQVCVEAGEYGFTNPEVGLLSFLYSYLPGHAALDIGANHGNVSEPLLKAGYEVYAFEPQPQVYEDLVRRLGNRDGFHVFPFALGSQEAEMPLHMAVDLSADKTYGDATGYSSLTQHSMPADLPFTSARPVMVKTLAGLQDAGTLPENIGLVKIDTEGYDLEVVRGMGERRYPVVATEFWDSEIPFGGANQLYTLESLVGEMRRRGYLWHIVLYRIWGQNQSGFYCNHDKSVPKTWGNVVFFQDYPVFAQAQAWCSAVLPRTYFKVPAQA